MEFAIQLEKFLSMFGGAVYQRSEDQDNPGGGLRFLVNEKKRRGCGDEVLVLEFYQGQWEMKRRDVNMRNSDTRNCNGRKRNIGDVNVRN